MGHGYTIAYDDRDLLEYSKTHKNGEKTRVKIEKVGTKATGGTSWVVNVKDPNGSQRLGRRERKSDAKQLARQWMNENPKGVSGAGGAMGTLDAMESVTENVFTGNGTFK